MELDENDVEIPQEVEFHEITKRSRDEEDPQVERELERGRLDALLEDRGDDFAMGLFWEDTVEPVTTPYELSELSVLPATRPEFLVKNLWSIRYDAGIDHYSDVSCAQGTFNRALFGTTWNSTIWIFSAWIPSGVCTACGLWITNYACGTINYACGTINFASDRSPSDSCWLANDSL